MGSGSFAPSALFGSGPLRLKSCGYRFEAVSVDSLAPTRLKPLRYRSRLEERGPRGAAADGPPYLSGLAVAGPAVDSGHQAPDGTNPAQ